MNFNPLVQLGCRKFYRLCDVDHIEKVHIVYTRTMTGFIENIEELTLKNTYFRQVLFTSQHAQLVVMSLNPNEEIGIEVHEIVDQFLRIEKGEGKIIMNGEESELHDGSAVIVPAGVKHNVINTSSENPLKLYTIYTPPHHKDGIIHKTKQEAETDTEDHI